MLHINYPLTRIIDKDVLYKGIHQGSLKWYKFLLNNFDK
jgi:hypothetical protein